MEMKLRYAPRYKRRLPVRFWEPESGDLHQAFTVDISLSGMFIATRSPLPQGARFRLELLEPEHNYVFYGEVVRAARVAPELQRLGRSGMGIRLLRVDELVSQLIPKAAGRPRTVSAPPERPAAASKAVASGAGRYVKTAPRAAGGGGTEKEDEVPVYLLRFASPEVFLQIFLNHRQEGGFFVPTRRPAAVGQEIRVTFELLRSEVQPLELLGRVESHLSEGVSPDSPATGMRVTFVEPDSAMEQLRAIIHRLRGGS